MPNNLKKDQVKTITFGDIVAPIISYTGELLGFELRKELATIAYQNYPQHIRKIVKNVISMNKMITEGFNNVFICKQFPGMDSKET